MVQRIRMKAINLGNIPRNIRIQKMNQLIGMRMAVLSLYILMELQLMSGSLVYAFYPVDQSVFLQIDQFQVFIVVLEEESFWSLGQCSFSATNSLKRKTTRRFKRQLLGGC